MRIPVCRKAVSAPRRDKGAGGDRGLSWRRLDPFQTAERADASARAGEGKREMATIVQQQRQLLYACQDNRLTLGGELDCAFDSAAARGISFADAQSISRSSH